MARVYVQCMCDRGNPPYLQLFETEERRDELYTRYGPHISMGQLLYEYRADYGRCMFPKNARVVLTGGGFVLFFDDNPATWSLNTAFAETGGIEWLTRTIPVVGSLNCRLDQHVPLPHEDGYCYLALYPRTMWRELHLKLGRWPSLSSLPPGRYPAVAKAVVADFVTSLALHCEKAMGEGAIDELRRFPGIACVGGGVSGVRCMHLGSGDDLCAACTRESRKGPLHSFGELDGAFVVPDVAYAFVRGDFPSYSRCSPGASTVKLRVGEQLSLRFPGDSGGAGYLLEVEGSHWSVDFPPGLCLQFGTYRFNTKRWLTMVGSGYANIMCSGAATNVHLRGITIARRDAILHALFGCDASDATARASTVQQCQLYFSPREYVPENYADRADKFLREDFGETGSAKRLVEAGSHVWLVPPEGLFLRAIGRVARVGDLQIAPGAPPVCLAYGSAAAFKTMPLLLYAGCNADGSMSPALRRRAVMTVMSRSPGLVKMGGSPRPGPSFAEVSAVLPGFTYGGAQFDTDGDPMAEHG